jgi:hypothetical protein
MNVSSYAQISYDNFHLKNNQQFTFFPQPQAKCLLLLFQVDHLNSRIRLLGVEGDADGEKVVGASGAGELHAAGLVVVVDDRQLPEQGAALLVRVVPVALGNDRGAGAVAENARNKNNVFGSKKKTKNLSNRNVEKLVPSH